MFVGSGSVHRLHAQRGWRGLAGGSGGGAGGRGATQGSEGGGDLAVQGGGDGAHGGSRPLPLRPLRDAALQPVVRHVWCLRPTPPPPHAAPDSPGPIRTGRPATSGVKDAHRCCSLSFVFSEGVLLRKRR